jgi:sugar lactone lactonase YvrE
MALALGYLLVAPAPIDDPEAFTPAPPPPMTGALSPNEALRAAERFAVPPGPETVLADAEGRMVAGTSDGRIVRVSADGREVVTLATTGGRPLGLAWDRGGPGRDGRLIVADAAKGLCAVDAAGKVEILVTSAAGVPLGFTDDVDVAIDGAIYFSDASSKYGYGRHMEDLLEGRGHGRLLRHVPATGRTDVLLEGLYFANGVALSPGGDFVLVVETGRYRVRRHFLRGPRAGTSDVFADNLPGYPDGIARGEDGRFWVAIFSPRKPIAERLAPRPALRRLLTKLPRAFWPAPERYGLVLALDREGRVVESLHDPGGARVHTVTAVEERGGVLYLGTLDDARIARLALASPAQ